MSKHEVSSPMMHGGIIPQQWEHLLEENRKLKELLGKTPQVIQQLLSESDMIEFYKERMVEHRTNAIASRKRAEAVEEEKRQLKSRVAELENLILDFKQTMDELESRHTK